jgi:NADH:ubiquinone oxidoreductase subunit 6 (subunit J)
MVVLAFIGSIFLLLLSVFGLTNAWEIERIWLRHLALLAGVVLGTVALYWLLTSLFIATGKIQTENVALWVPAFIGALLWLYMTFIIDRRDRADRGKLNR